MLITNPLTPTVSPKTIPERIQSRLRNDFRLFFRRRIRQQIMPLLPVHQAPQEGSTLHMLVCERDHEMAIITAGLFNYRVGTAHRFVFHDDGSLSDRAIATFQEFLPGTRVIRRPEADEVAQEKLKDFPRILAYRRSQIMALKIVDVKLWGQGTRMGYVDSDVLFLKHPKAYVQALEEQPGANYFNRDIEDAYVADRKVIGEATGYEPAPRMNAGLWVMNAQDIRLEQIEAWLGHPFFAPYAADYRLDQTFIAMLAQDSAAGAKHFPEEYDVDFYKQVDQNVCKHYVGRIRYGYELEGLRYVLSQGDLKKDSL